MSAINAVVLHDLNCKDLVGIAGRHTHLEKVGHYWEGPCPFDGGKDRFQIKQRPDGEYRWYCRHCSDGKYLDVISFIERLERVGFFEAVSILSGGQIRQATPEEIAERKQQQAREQAERQAELARVTEKYSTSEIWQLFVNRMTDENRQWWRGQGIPDTWIDFWRLGFTPDKAFEYRETLYHSPAYTIPKFDYGWLPTNIDYRLTQYPVGAGKYRPAAELPPAPFLSRPDLNGIADEVVIVEGSKKAMVCTIYGVHNDNGKIHVFGIPSKNSWAGIVEKVAPCGRVWIALDPDATNWAYKLGSAIGKNARVMEMPFKPDDGFLYYGLDAKGWRELQKYARVPKEVNTR